MVCKSHVPFLKERIKMLIAKTYRFNSAHYIPEHEKCGEIHGHTWSITIGVVGAVQEDGMVYDFHSLNIKVKDILSTLDHTLLNYTLPVPTAENIAMYIGKELDKILPSYLTKIHVKVKEGDGGFAIYIRKRGEDADSED
jgi:6-pyruvoyltetrahydropterin/6-carboxytetrahydropterin synthase